MSAPRFPARPAGRWAPRGPRSRPRDACRQRVVGEAHSHLVEDPRPRGGREWLPSRRLDQGVAALERALGIVPAEREREALEVAHAPLTAVAQRGVGLALQHERAPPGEAPLLLQLPA